MPMPALSGCECCLPGPLRASWQPWSTPQVIITLAASPSYLILSADSAQRTTTTDDNDCCKSNKQPMTQPT